MNNTPFVASDLMQTNIFLRAALHLALQTLVRLDKGGEHRPDRKEMKSVINHLKAVLK